MNTQTRLNRKVAHVLKVCTYCNKKIQEGDVYHAEEGIDSHLHSLLARQFCTNCYAKYGEQKLLKGNK